MRVTYIGPHDGVEVPSLDIAVKRNESVDVPNDVGHNLVQQADWETTRNPVARLSAPTGATGSEG